MKVKCGKCEYCCKDTTPICANPSSTNYQNEVDEEYYCILGKQKSISIGCIGHVGVGKNSLADAILKSMHYEVYKKIDE